ncbi:MAG TPA: hypothetical protein VK171_08490, partial [Fimbriimonas sp.]|nr:hypothetical protein [Fimbriimonas sp.]
DCIIEAPGYVDRNGINMPMVGDLPLGCAAVCNASVSVQRLAVEAAMTGDIDLLKQAMMMDPLTGAVCDPREIWQMADKMIVALRDWLPQFEEQIPDIAKGLKREPSLARFKGNQGSARLVTRTVDQMASDDAAKKAAKSSDKAGMSN